MILLSCSFCSWSKTIVEEFDPGAGQEAPLDKPDKPAVSKSTGYTWSGYKGSGSIIQLLNKPNWSIDSSIALNCGNGNFNNWNAWTVFGNDSVSNLGTITFKWLPNSASGNMQLKALIQDAQGSWYVSDDTAEDQVGASTVINARTSTWKGPITEPVINTAIDLTDLSVGKPDLSKVTGGGFVTIGKNNNGVSRLDSMTWTELGQPVIADAGVFCSRAQTFTFRGKILAGNPDVSLHYRKAGGTDFTIVSAQTEGNYFSCEVENLGAGEYNYFFKASNALGENETDPVSFTVKENVSPKSSIVETFGYPTEFPQDAQRQGFKGNSGVSSETGYSWTGVSRGASRLLWNNSNGIILDSNNNAIDGNLWTIFNGDSIQSPLYAQIKMMSDSIHEYANFFFVIQDAKGDWYVTTKYSVESKFNLVLNEATWKRIDDPVKGQQFNTLDVGTPDFSYITGGGIQFNGQSEKEVKVESLTWKSEGEAPQISYTDAKNDGWLSVILSGSVVAGLPTPKVTVNYWKEGTSETNTVDVGEQSGDFVCRLIGLEKDSNYSYFFTATNTLESVNSEIDSFMVTLPDGTEKTELIEDFGLPASVETEKDDWVFTTGISSSTGYTWNGVGGGYRMYWYDKAGVGVIGLNSYNLENVDGHLWAFFNGDTVKSPTLFRLKMASGSTHETTFVKPIIQDNVGNWFQATNEMSLAKGERAIDLVHATWKQIEWPELGKKQIVESGNAEPDLTKIVAAGVSFRGRGSKDVLFDSFSWLSQEDIAMTDGGVVDHAPLSVTIQGEVTAGAPMPSVTLEWWKEGTTSVFQKDLGPKTGLFQVKLEGQADGLIGGAKYGYRFVATNGMSNEFRTLERKFITPSQIIRELLVRFDGSINDQGVYQPASGEIIPEGGPLLILGTEKTVANGVCTFPCSEENKGARIWWKYPGGLTATYGQLKKNFVMEMVMAYSPKATHYDWETLMSFGVYTRLYWNMKNNGLTLRSYNGSTYPSFDTKESVATDEKHYALVHTVIDAQHSKIDFYVEGKLKDTLKMGPVYATHNYDNKAGGVAFGNGTMAGNDGTKKATFGTYSAVSFSSFEGEFNPKTDFQILYPKGTVLILK